MSGQLPDNLPPSARVGLNGPDAQVPSRFVDLSPAEQKQLARHALIHALLPLALEDQRARQDFAGRVRKAIVPDAAPFTQQVVTRLARPSARFERSTTSRLSRVPSSRITRVSTARITRVSTGRVSRASSRRQVKRSPTRFVPYALAAAVAACVAIVLVWQTSFSAAPTASPATDNAIAVMANSESATWATPPGPLIPGVRLRLTSGLVELDLRGKGRLVLDGPADLELTDAMRAVLRDGRLVLAVTPEGHGYQVGTPSGTFTDLGTRFGVIVTDGTAEAHVMEGSISAHTPQNPTPIVLTQDKAARLRSGRLEHIPVDPGAFYTRLPPHVAQTSAQIRWRMDEGSGAQVRAEVQGFPSANADLTLTAVTGSSPPKWTTGHRGNALIFDGRGGYAESGFPGIAGTQPRTVTCWIRMPRDFRSSDGFAIVSWGDPLTPGRGEVWQISLNPIAQDGPLGRIRVGTHGGRLVGTTDLRDDQWHHVAVVMYGGAQPDIGTHVMVYVDGKLEPISRRTLQTIDTRIVDDGHGVWVGRNVTHQADNRNSPHGFLRGAVDDLVITAGALTQDEIRVLMDGR